MTRKFTGWHFLTIIVAFFAVVIAVNVLMAHYALSTFGGTVVDNSYVASQEFNGWLAKARHQAALGWTTDYSLDGERHVVIDAKARGVAIDGAAISGVAKHPLGRARDVALHFVADGNGRYRAVESLPDGRWAVHLSVRHGGNEARLIETLG